MAEQRAHFRPARATHRIRPQVKLVTKNPLGEEVVTWSDAIQDTPDNGVWGEVQPIRGREFFAAAATQYAADVRVLLRYRPGLTREHRLLIDDVPHDITQIVDVGAEHRTLEIIAVNGVRNGR